MQHCHGMQLCTIKQDPIINIIEKVNKTRSSDLSDISSSFLKILFE